MKAKNGFATVFCVAIAMAAMVVLFSNPAYADSKVSKSIQVHNGDSQQRTATDLTFTIKVPDCEKESYWMKSYSVSTQPPLGGTVTHTPHTNTSGKVWRVDISYDGISVPYCVTIQIDAEVTLNSWNYLYILDVKWSYDDPGGERHAVPDHSFHYPRPGETEYGENTHNTLYTFVNEDLYTPIMIEYLQFYQEPQWFSPAGQWDSISNLVYDMDTPIELAPGESLFVALDDLPNLPSSYIYTSGQMSYQMPGSEPEVGQFMDGHEEEASTIPTLTEWGMIILGILFMGGIVWFVWRNRRDYATAGA